MLEVCHLAKRSGFWMIGHLVPTFWKLVWYSNFHMTKCTFKYLALKLSKIPIVQILGIWYSDVHCILILYTKFTCKSSTNLSEWHHLISSYRLPWKLTKLKNFDIKRMACNIDIWTLFLLSAFLQNFFLCQDR